MTQRTTIIGTNQTTPGDASAPLTLLVDNTDALNTTGLVVTQNASAPATQNLLEVQESDGTVTAAVTNGLDFATYGMKFGAVAGVFLSMTCLNGQQNPPCIEIGGGARVWSGTGAPASGTVGTGRVGDWYLRRDTPSTANQRVYLCTVAGTPGTWTAIA